MHFSRITFPIKAQRFNRESVKVESDNQVCRLVYRGMHDGKRGVEKICTKA